MLKKYEWKIRSDVHPKYLQMIKFAETNLTEYSLRRTLEEPMQTGETLFSAASYSSELITEDLIVRDIKINFINDLFMTRASTFILFIVLAG